MKRFAPILAITLLLCMAAATSFAHKVRVFAYVEGSDIVGETAFSGGKSAQNVAIEIYNEADHVLLTETRSNEKGEFSLPIPDLALEQRLDLLIVVNGGDGHKNSWLLKAEEYLPPSPTSDQGQAAVPAAPTAESSSPAAVEGEDDPALPGTAAAQQLLSEETLRRIVDESVEKQLRPVKHMLAENREKRVSLQDIIGGFGYIFGLAGIAAYFSSRKRIEKGERQ